MRGRESVGERGEGEGGLGERSEVECGRER